VVCVSEEGIADMGRFGIQRWFGRFNRSFAWPTPEQLAKLRNALEESDNLDQRTQEQLRFSMKGFN
jgi:hypothetical protein